MYEWIWKNFKIKNIAKVYLTETTLNLLNNTYKMTNQGGYKMSDKLSPKLLKSRLESVINLHYSSDSVYSVYNNNLIIHKTNYTTNCKIFPNEFIEMLPEPKQFGELYYFNIDEADLLYISLKFGKYEIENITNLKEIQVIDKNLLIYKKD